MFPLPWVLLGAALVLLGSHTGAYRYGQHVRGAEHAQQQYALALAYARELAARQDTVDALAAELEHARAAQRPRDRIITKEVLRYVQTVPAARRCTLDGAWRLLHDAAATGEPPEPARLAAGDAPAVADHSALDAVAGNYEACRAARAQVIGWQRWWATVRQEALP